GERQHGAGPGGDADLPVLEEKRAGPRWRRAGWKDDVARRIGAKAVLALVEPVEPDERQPARLGAQALLAVRAPGGDVGLERRPRRRRAVGASEVRDPDGGDREEGEDRAHRRQA